VTKAEDDQRDGTPKTFEQLIGYDFKDYEDRCRVWDEIRKTGSSRLIPNLATLPLLSALYELNKYENAEWSAFQDRNRLRPTEDEVIVDVGRIETSHSVWDIREWHSTSLERDIRTVHNVWRKLRKQRENIDAFGDVSEKVDSTLTSATEGFKWAFFPGQKLRVTDPARVVSSGKTGQKLGGVKKDESLRVPASGHFFGTVVMYDDQGRKAPEAYLLVGDEHALSRLRERASTIQADLEDGGTAVCRDVDFDTLLSACRKLNMKVTEQRERQGKVSKRSGYMDVKPVSKHTILLETKSSKYPCAVNAYVSKKDGTVRNHYLFMITYIPKDGRIEHVPGYRPDIGLGTYEEGRGQNVFCSWRGVYLLPLAQLHGDDEPYLPLLKLSGWHMKRVSSLVYGCADGPRRVKSLIDTIDGTGLLACLMVIRGCVCIPVSGNFAIPWEKATLDEKSMHVYAMILALRYTISEPSGRCPRLQVDATKTTHMLLSPTIKGKIVLTYVCHPVMMNPFCINRAAFKDLMSLMWQSDTALQRTNPRTALRAPVSVEEYLSGEYGSPRSEADPVSDVMHELDLVERETFMNYVSHWNARMFGKYKRGPREVTVIDQTGNVEEDCRLMLSHGARLSQNTWMVSASMGNLRMLIVPLPSGFQHMALVHHEVRPTSWASTVGGRVLLQGRISILQSN